MFLGRKINERKVVFPKRGIAQNKTETSRDFPGVPVVSASTAGGTGLIPVRRNKILHAARHGQKQNKTKTSICFYSFCSYMM